MNYCVGIAWVLRVAEAWIAEQTGEEAPRRNAAAPGSSPGRLNEPRLAVDRARTSQEPGRGPRAIGRRHGSPSSKGVAPMDPKRFDMLARMFAHDVSRRTALRRVGVSLASAAVAGGVPAGRALAQDASAAQEGDEDGEGPVDEPPRDARPLRGDCQPHGLGCRDWDGDGVCAIGFLTADCEIVEGRECRCPPPPPVCTCQRICRSASGGITTTEIRCSSLQQSAEEDASGALVGENPPRPPGGCCTECDDVCQECHLPWQGSCRLCRNCLRRCSITC